MDRKDFFQKLIGGLLALPFVVKAKQIYYGEGNLDPIRKFPLPVVVETLEHEGWDYVGSGAGLKYVTQWTFSTKEEAEQFVRSLMPRLRKLHFHKKFYAGAQEPTNMEVEIVSKQPDGTEKIVLENHRHWFDIGFAWMYLSNIRINGEPVARPTRPGGSLSQYYVQPFIKGNPKVTWGDDV